MSQWQWLMSSFERPTFSEPKSIATGAVLNCRRIVRAPLRAGAIRAATRGGLAAVVPTHQTAVGHGFCHGFIFFCVCQQLCRADGRTRFAECDFVGIHDAQMRGSEVAHGAGGGSNVERISRCHEHYAQIV